MKKMFFVSVLLLILVSCKSNPVTSLDHKAQIEIKGNWTLTKVSYIGSEYFKVDAFQIADSKCFEGSLWKFISNNNKGEITLTKNGCPSFSSSFVWSINQEGNFGLKLVNAGEKARKIQQGYFLKVANLTETSFQLIDKIEVGGKLSDIVYLFQKN